MIDEGSQAEAAFRKRMADDFMLFVDELVIPSAFGPKRFGDIMEPFQRECFESLAPSLKAVKDGTMPPARRFWVERTKKAAKDSDLAVCLAWLIGFAKRPFLGQVSAANRKQAAVVKRRIAALLFYNSWLKEYLSIQVNRIINNDRTAEVVIEATESASAINKTAGGTHGEAPDLLILNELVHVARWETNESHMHNAEGVPQGIVMVFTNAGFKGTPAALWKTEAISNPKRWIVKEWKGMAPWLNKEDMEEAKRLDPMRTQYNRLWLGIWQSGKGNGLDEELIEHCFRGGLKILKAPELGWVYVAAVDLGVVHDHSGVALVGINTDERRIKVQRVKGWAPDPKTPNPTTGKPEVSGELVERYCLWLHRMFNTVWFGYDPAEGGRFFAQDLRKKGVPMVEVSFSNQKTTGDMAEALVQLVKGGKLECYDDKEGRLRRDLGKFSLVPKAKALGGYKLEAISDEEGHADVGVAMTMCLPKALELLGGYNIFTRDTVVAMAPLQDDEATEEELEVMPEELLTFYEPPLSPFLDLL